LGSRGIGKVDIPLKGLLTFARCAHLAYEVLFKYTVPAVPRYRLDLAALARTPIKIVLAGGSAGRESLVYQCTVALTERLGNAVVEFPSHHTGYISHPRAFAERLREVLGDQGFGPLPTMQS
jgi:hypothetical protein